MSVQRYTNALGRMVPVERGSWVVHTDYAALEARCAGLEEALIVISRLPYCDRHLSKDLARVALDDTTTDEVQP